MEGTKPVREQTGDAPSASQSGRTWGDKILVGAGALTLAAGAIEGALKALGGVFKQTQSLSDVLHLQGATSWAALLSLVVLGAWLLYLGTRKRSRLLRPEAMT